MTCNERIYLWTPRQIREVILDAVELQKAKIIKDDMSAGMTSYVLTMYGQKREYQVTVAPASRNRSRVKIEISGGKGGNDEIIDKQFALYESLMLTFTPQEYDTDIAPK